MLCLMRTRSATARAALCGCVTAVVFTAGLASGAAPAATATPSVVTPAPPAPGGSVPVQPVGGGGCIIGLNCGCIRNVTCPSPHPRRPNVDNNQHAAPAPPNP
ncbi:hypothetical protein A5708_17895 [Mycobacterium colombiense]|uniref:Secreted protein n=2 Tax=Mycobacterium colombiense TaxID=339268 RepID=A0A1A2Z2G5_9MYCO|nr:hypothetical protein A5708_17895 [Mycobacterium colombiense]